METPKDIVDDLLTALPAKRLEQIYSPACKRALAETLSCIDCNHILSHAGRHVSSISREKMLVKVVVALTSMAKYLSIPVYSSLFAIREGILAKVNAYGKDSVLMDDAKTKAIILWAERTVTHTTAEAFKWLYGLTYPTTLKSKIRSCKRAIHTHPTIESISEECVVLTNEAGDKLTFDFSQDPLC